MGAILEQENSLVEYLITGRLSEKGQLVLPKEFRDDLNLEAGSPIAILRLGNGLLLLPEMEKFKELCQRIGRTLQNAQVEPEELLATLPDTRREVFRKLYPKLAENETDL